MLLFPGAFFCFLTELKAPGDGQFSQTSIFSTVLSTMPCTLKVSTEKKKLFLRRADNIIIQINENLYFKCFSKYYRKINYYENFY